MILLHLGQLLHLVLQQLLVLCRLVNTSSFNWSLASCDMHPVRSFVQKNLYKLAISEISDAWTILPVILQVEIFVCSVALGLPCVGKRDAFDFSSYKQKFCQENCKKLLHNYPDYTTDNFRRLLPEFQTLKYT